VLAAYYSASLSQLFNLKSIFYHVHTTDIRLVTRLISLIAIHIVETCRAARACKAYEPYVESYKAYEPYVESYVSRLYIVKTL